MKSYMKVVRAISLVGQLGFTLLTPPLVMILLAWWLQRHFGLGTWIMILCLLVGLLTAAASAVRFFRHVLKNVGEREAQKDKEEGEDHVVFYRHE